MANTHAVTDETFEQEVLRSETPVLVDFWAPWCPPCRMLAPELEKLAEEERGALTVAKLDIDQNAEAPARYGVQSIPTLLLFKGGQEVARLVGYMPKVALAAQLAKHLGPAPVR
jgi:thioredoxin 1